MDIPVTNDNASAIGTSTGIGLGVMKMLEDRDACLLLFWCHFPTFRIDVLS